MKFHKIISVAALCLTAATVNAADYPTRPIRYVTSGAPGQPQDTAARAFAEKLSKRLGQPVVVENRPGAFGLIALNAALSAPPDGYTIYASSSQLISQPALVKGFAHDLSRDVTAVTKLVEFRTAGVVKASSPFRTMDDLVAHMKANPGKLNLGVSSAIDTLIAKAFQKATGTRFEEVRFSGAPQGYTSLIGGGIDAMLVAGISSTKGSVDAGKLRFIAVNGTERDALIPDVPAMSESASPQIRQLSKSAMLKPFWLGIMVPSKVPPEVVQTLFEATRDVMKDPELIKNLHAVGLHVVRNPPSPDQATKELIEDASEITRAAKEAGIEPQ
ncbi:MAG TPA: tripartite tricarboxylate transporter substrate binding protein [Ramlibacter sp.]|nr:tripartite tricarboxylate transporter substrate binding protein [Ramlibacter sp.]